jgi:hypothetical protein
MRFKARAASSVTCGTNLVDSNQHAIGVTVHENALHQLNVPGRIALAPIRLTRARPERNSSFCDGALQSFGVHVGEHQDIAIRVVLDYHWYESVGIETNSVWRELDHEFLTDKPWAAMSCFTAAMDTSPE